MILNLEQLRRKRKWSKNKLSRLSGVSVAYICDLEQKKYTNPSISILCKLSGALGCTLDELVNCGD